MTNAIAVDVRVPIGGLFLVLGAMLAAYGLTPADDVERFAGTGSENIDLWWGLVMAVFGGALLLLARVSRRRAAARLAEGSRGQSR